MKEKIIFIKVNLSGKKSVKYLHLFSLKYTCNEFLPQFSFIFEYANKSCLIIEDFKNLEVNHDQY